MITCFLIDDDQDDHDFFKTAIKKIDPAITVHIAENGKEGLEKLPALKPKPDVIFLDINMPVLGGLEFLDEFEKTKSTHIPVVIYSTSGEHFFKEKARERGASGYLQKTYTMQSLRDGLAIKLREMNLL